MYRMEMPYGLNVIGIFVVYMIYFIKYCKFSIGLVFTAFKYFFFVCVLSQEEVEWMTAKS